MNWLKTHRAEALLFLSILACVLEGAFRKWVFRESDWVGKYGPYFSKDIIFIALIVFCRPRGVDLTSKSFKRVLYIGIPFILIGAALSAVVGGVSLVGAFLSFRSLILLPLLAFLAVPRLAGVKLESVAFLLGFLMLINTTLGILQYSSAVDSPLNYYASEKVVGAVAYAENVRAVGTFSYITGFANLATIGAWAGLSLLSLARGRLLYICFGWAVYLAALISALVSISRGTVVVVLTLFLIWVLSGARLGANLLKTAVALIAIASLAFALNFTSVLVRLGTTVLERHEASEDTVEGRILDPILEVLPAAERAPGGAGFGSEQVGGIFADYGVMSFRSFENQFPRLILETGLLGLIGFLVTSLGALYVLYEARRRISDEGMRRVIVLSIFLVGSFFNVNVAFNHVASFFAWITIVVTLASLSRPYERRQPSTNGFRLIEGAGRRVNTTQGASAIPYA